jgi:alpha-galactosidase
VFGTAIDEWKMREFIDYIASYLRDAGPWHILLDAGWFIAEGRPGAELSRVDTEKFPSGIRALVDYAHARDIRMILASAAGLHRAVPGLADSTRHHRGAAELRVRLLEPRSAPLHA